MCDYQEQRKSAGRGSPAFQFLPEPHLGAGGHCHAPPGASHIDILREGS